MEVLEPRPAGLFFGRAARSALIGLLLGAALCSFARAAPASWPDTYEARVAALALLQTLNADLLSHDSATATLQRWCESHHLAPDPKIVATQAHVDAKAPTEEQREALRVAANDEVRFRHVRLSCGSLVLSEADNWYVPDRLTAPMNHLLETTETPFGAVVRDLHFQRHTLSARLLWMPLPEDWEMNRPQLARGSGTLTVPAQVLEHRAILSLPDGTPFSEVVETYSGNVLAFAPPQADTGAARAPH